MRKEEVEESMRQLDADNAALQLTYHREKFKDPITLDRPQVKNCIFSVKGIINYAYNDIIDGVVRGTYVQDNSYRYPYYPHSSQDESDFLKDANVKIIQTRRPDIYELLKTLQPWWNGDSTISTLCGYRNKLEHDKSLQTKILGEGVELSKGPMHRPALIVKGKQITIAGVSCECVSLLGAVEPKLMQCRFSSVLIHDCTTVSIYNCQFNHLSSTDSDVTLHGNIIDGERCDFGIYISGSKITSDPVNQFPNFMKSLNATKFLAADTSIQIVTLIDDAIDIVQRFIHELYMILK